MSVRNHGETSISTGGKGLGMRSIVCLVTAMLAGALGAALLGTPPVSAVDSDMVDLQESVNQVIQGQKDTEATLLQTAAVSKTRMEGSMSTLSRMPGNVLPLQKTVQEMQANSNARLETMSTQIHGISDNLQETRARMAKLNQQLTALQNALRGMDAKLAHSAPVAPPRVPPKR